MTKVVNWIRTRQRKASFIWKRTEVQFI